MEIRFRDRVKVTRGFYQGCEGVVMSEEKIASDTYVYEVYIHMLVNNSEWVRETITIRETDLEVIKKASKVTI